MMMVPDKEPLQYEIKQIRIKRGADLDVRQSLSVMSHVEVCPHCFYVLLQMKDH